MGLFNLKIHPRKELFKLKIKPQIPFAPPSGAFLLFPITLKINNPFFLIQSHRIIDFSLPAPPISCCMACCIVSKNTTKYDIRATIFGTVNSHETLINQRKTGDLSYFLNLRFGLGGEI